MPCLWPFISESRPRLFGVMVALVVRPYEKVSECLANVRFSVALMGRRRLGELMT